MWDESQDKRSGWMVQEMPFIIACLQKNNKNKKITYVCYITYIVEKNK